MVAEFSGSVCMFEASARALLAGPFGVITPKPPPHRPAVRRASMAIVTHCELVSL